MKVAVACLFVLLLMYAGLKGRQHASLQAKLNEITRVRNQLQQKLDEEQRPAEQIAARLAGTYTNESRPPLSTPQIAALVGTLKTQLDEFDSEYSPGELAEVEGLEVRLTRATLANAEGRFGDTLTTLTEQDEIGKPASTGAQIGRLARLLQIRADSLYGLHKWQEALDRYRQVMVLQTNRVVAIARAADCQYALARQTEALATSGELAKSYDNRALDFLVQGKTEAAVENYNKAIGLQTRLIDQQGRTELVSELAKSHFNRGNAFLIRRQLEAALADFEKAIELQTRLIEQQGRIELASDLGKSHHNRGNVFLAQGKPDAAGAEFEKAIQILTRLAEKEGRSELLTDLEINYANRGIAFLAQANLDAALGDFEKAIQILTPLIKQQGPIALANDLVRSYNNRGVVRRAQGKLAPALADFENAIKILTRFIGPGGQGDFTHRPGNDNHPGPGGSTEVKLEVAMGYSESNPEALVRTRLAQQGERTELAVLLAVSLKNRGYAHLLRSQPDAAINDFKNAAEIYASIVERDGETTLGQQFAASLTPIAWVYATNPDNSLRDGIKAREYAMKACQASEWKAFVPLETLAAACAETGNFPDAVKWQQKALELAPAKYKSELSSRLELYRSGNSYRAALPKAE